MATQGSNRGHNDVQAPRTQVVLLHAHASGGGAAASCTFDAQETLNGEITALTFASTGVYTGTFRYLYPELKGAPIVSFGGATTAGIMGIITAIDVVAGTFTLKTYVGNTLTDLATTDIPYFSWAVRASGKNK